MEVYARDLMSVMNAWAPPELAESWDHPGLQVGDPEQTVRRVLTALDVTRENVSYAKNHHIDMIISHHPFLFRGVKTIDLQTEKGKILQDLIVHGICAFAAHTNLDTARGGVNDTLAAMLGLTDCTGLVPRREEKWVKLVVYVPVSYGDRMRNALASAGAGVIGAYSGCSFTVSGIGRFLPGKGTHPFIGKEGRWEETEEERIETILPDDLVADALSAMRAAHPYEEPAYDLYELKNPGQWNMMGRVGNWPYPMTARDAAVYIKKKLGIPAVKMAGPPDKFVRRAAVLGGAGIEFAKAAQQAGADLYLTGDVKYHEAQEAAALGLVVVDGGHFYTERGIISTIARRLKKVKAERQWDVQIIEDPTAQDVFLVL